MNFMLYINRTMGVIFCHVRISKQFIQLSPSITSGNQKWNGVIPIFVSRAEFIVRIVRLLISKFIGMFYMMNLKSDSFSSVKICVLFLHTTCVLLKCT